ncbi:hypothetical protein CVT24_004360 [Panaeolus cyanescens]|uniref:Uncharacterized protein n=1 Tax=Panaeolus cyanescens TaxID=181874 RepID=A0A409YBH8_9AGAR|nr:hypothetical protein CVT24_004360 [Panaeolus cyanescens]
MFDFHFHIRDTPVCDPDVEPDSEPNSLTNTNEIDNAHTTNLPTPTSEPQATSTSTTHAGSSDNLRSVMGTLSLACPAFLHTSRRYIFSSITIKFSHSTYYPPFLPPVQRLRDLAKLLDDNPMLRRHVQSIKFIFPRQTIAEPRDMNFDGGLASLFHLPNVTFIFIQPADEDESETHHCPYPSICIHHNRVAYAQFTKSIVYSYLHSPNTRLTTLLIIDMDDVPLEDILSARSLLRLRIDDCYFKDALMYPPGSPTPKFALIEFTARNPDNLPVYLLSLCPQLEGVGIVIWNRPDIEFQTSYKVRAGTAVDAATMGSRAEPVSNADPEADSGDIGVLGSRPSVELPILPFSRLTKAQFGAEPLRFKMFYEEAEKRGVMAFPVLDELIIYVDDDLQALLGVYEDDVDGGRKIEQLHRMFHHMPELKKISINGRTHPARHVIHFENLCSLAPFPVLEYLLVQFRLKIPKRRMKDQKGLMQREMIEEFYEDHDFHMLKKFEYGILCVPDPDSRSESSDSDSEILLKLSKTKVAELNSNPTKTSLFALPMAHRHRPEDFNAFGYDPRGRIANAAALLFGENWRPDPDVPRYQGPEVAAPRFGPPAPYQLPYLPENFVAQQPHNGYLGALQYQQRQGPWVNYPFPAGQQPYPPHPPPLAPHAYAQPALAPQAHPVPHDAHAYPAMGNVHEPPAAVAHGPAPAGPRLKAGPNPETSTGVYRMTAHLVCQKLSKQFTFESNIDYNDFRSRACANLDVSPDTAQLGYRIRGSEGPKTIPASLNSATDFSQAMERICGFISRARSKEYGIEVVNINEKPATSNRKGSKTANKRTRDEDIPPLFESSDAARRTYKELATATRCEKCKGHCHVMRDGTHQKLTIKDMSYWTKQIVLGNAALDKPPEAIIFDHRVKRARPNNSKNDSKQEIHVHIQGLQFGGAYHANHPYPLSATSSRSSLSSPPPMSSIERRLSNAPSTIIHNSGSALSPTSIPEHPSLYTLLADLDKGYGGGTLYQDSLTAYLDAGIDTIQSLASRDLEEIVSWTGLSIDTVSVTQQSAIHRIAAAPFGKGRASPTPTSTGEDNTDHGKFNDSDSIEMGSDSSEPSEASGASDTGSSLASSTQASSP